MTQFLISHEHTLTCMYTITILNACFLESIRKLYFNHTEKRSGCTALDGIKFNYYTYYVLIVFLAVYDKKKKQKGQHWELDLLKNKTKNILEAAQSQICRHACNIKRM